MLIDDKVFLLWWYFVDKIIFVLFVCFYCVNEILWVYVIFGEVLYIDYWMKYLGKYLMSVGYWC